MADKIGRSRRFSEPGLDLEIDRIYNFFRRMGPKWDTSDYFTGKTPARGFRVGEVSDSPTITSYMAIQAADASRTIGANSNLYYSVADSDFPILGEIELGTTVTLYRDPWDEDLQLTHSIVSGDLKVRLTNDTGSDITIASGKWYVTLINHL